MRWMFWKKKIRMKPIAFEPRGSLTSSRRPSLMRDILSNEWTYIVIMLVIIGAFLYNAIPIWLG